MNQERFQELLDELDGNSLETLKEKNARYSQNEDSLHNFRSGAEIAGGTPAQACWGYLTKHLVALRDMVDKNDFSNREDFLEKCQDTINYIRFLWCIGNDEECLASKIDDDCKVEMKIEEVNIVHKLDDSEYLIYKNRGNLRVFENGDGFDVTFETPFGTRINHYSFNYYYAVIKETMNGKPFTTIIKEKESN